MDYQKILITGGSGFIGTNAINYFEEKGCEVINLSDVEPRNAPQLSRYKQCDIRDREKLLSHFKDFRPDAVLHLGARCDMKGKTLEEYDSNIQGTRNVIEATQAVGTVKRALYASSRLVFEIHHKPSHDYDYTATTVYGQSKVEMEKIVREQPAESVPWVMFRPTSIWGEWFEIPYKTFFLTVSKGRYLHPRGLSILKSFGYVGNIVYELDRYLHAPIENVGGKVFFVADFQPIDVLKFGESIRGQMGAPPIRQVSQSLLKAAASVGDLAERLGYKNAPLTSFRLDNLLTNMVYDMSREEAVCGPLPFTMDEGVERTVRWMRDSGQL